VDGGKEESLGSSVDGGEDEDTSGGAGEDGGILMGDVGRGKSKLLLTREED
jgi:hypothetical protein